MKNEKGYTLISAIMYMLLATIIISIVVAISASIIKSYRVANDNTTQITEINKINMYMLAETDNIDNKVLLISSGGAYIEFSSR